ncbi:MAG: efflux RND transporter periplasmic adaptor subunit, partial [Pseudomonadota bacterium]
LGSLLQPGGACATLISLNPIKLVGFVPEQDVERLDFGAPAGARLITGQVLSGQVSFLSRSADEVTRTFRVEIQVPNEDQSIRDGVTAEIMIGLDGATGHLVPQSALTLNDTGELGIRANEDGIARFMPVTPIRDDAEGVWISGLPDSVEIIVVGQDFVRDGRKIDVTYKESAL